MVGLVSRLRVGALMLCSACAAVTQSRAPEPAPVEAPESHRPSTTRDAASSGPSGGLNATVVPADGYVLLRHDAWVRATPSPTAERARLFMLEPDADPDPLRLHHVASVVARSGPFVGLESRPIPFDEAGCYRAVGRATMFKGFDLRVWVHEEDLLEVVVEPREHRLEGAHILLAPGVAVGPASDGIRRVAHEAMTLTMPIPDAAVGKVFYPKPGELHSSDAHLEPECGDAPCSFELAPDVRIELDDSVAVDVLKSDRQQATVALHARCMVVTTSVPAADIKPGPPPRFFGGSACGGYSVGKDFLAWPGAAVEFADGTPAGVVGKRGAHLRRGNRKDDPERACFARGPLDDMDCQGLGQHLTLCMPLDEVTPLPRGGRVGDHRAQLPK